MAKVMGWSPTEMREREDAFAALVDAQVEKVTRKVAAVMAGDRVVVAAGGVPAPPVDLGSIGVITGLWHQSVAAEIMPALTSTYLESASVIWQGIDEAFDQIEVPPVSDSFAEDYLAKATNRLVGIGQLTWQNIRQELLVGFALGEGITKLRDRVAAAGQISLARANVIARTEVNAASNAGAHQQVLITGLTGTKEWLDTNDDRTRCSHKAAGGQTVGIREKFKLGGPECGTATAYLDHPGDPTAPPSEIIQCRCSTAYDLSMDDDPLTAADFNPDEHPRNPADGQFIEHVGDELKALDPKRLTDSLYRDSGTYTGKQITDNFRVTHTTRTKEHADSIREEGFNPKKGSGHGQVLGRGTYLALDDRTRRIYDSVDSEVLDVEIDPDAKFLSTFGAFTYGHLKEAAKLLPGGEKQWRALTAKYETKGNPEPAAAALRQLAMAAGYDGLVARDPTEMEGAFGSGGNQVVVWTDKVRVAPSKDKALTAAATEVNSGAMIALMPTAEDANALALTGAYAEPATELHVTLLYLGEAASWDEENRRLLTGIIDEITQRYVPIATETFSVNVFNPNSNEFDTAVVLGVRGSDLLIALHKTITENIIDIFNDEVPTQHTPWVPHITLAYTDEVAEVMPEALDKLGPVTFDRVRVAFAGTITDYPLVGAEEDDPLVAADAEWDESKVKRDSHGKFAKKPGAKILSAIEAAIHAGDFSGLKKISGAKGSNPGGIYEDADGNRWYVKKQKDKAHAVNEKQASALYRAAGIDVPEVIIGKGTPELAKGIHTATKIVDVDASTKLADVASGKNPDKLAAVRRGFALDALLANWDVAGLTYDNVVFGKDGKPYRIDVGGALEFRAQGAPKGSAFGTSVTEWDTLRDPGKNQQSATLFEGMTPEQLRESVKLVQDLTPEKIKAVVDDPLAEKLIARRADLLKRAEKEGVLPAPTPVTAPTPVSTGGLDTSAIWTNIDEGNYRNGQVLATGSAHGTPVRLIATNDGESGTSLFVAEQYQSADGKWHDSDYWLTKQAFTTADLSGYSGSNAIVTDTDEADFEFVDEAPKNILDLTPTIVSPPALITSDSDKILTPESPTDVWTGLGTKWAPNEVVATGEVKDKNGANPLRIVAKETPGGFFLVEYELVGGTWQKSRTWNSQGEFETADLSEYPKFQTHKLLMATVPGTDSTNPYTGKPIYTPVGKLKNGSKDDLWKQLEKGMFADGDVVADYVDDTGVLRRIVVRPGALGALIFKQERQNPDGTWSVSTSFPTQNSWNTAYLTPFGIEKVTAPSFGPTSPSIKFTSPSEIFKALSDGSVVDGQVMAQGNDVNGGHWRLVATAKLNGGFFLREESAGKYADVSDPSAWSMYTTYNNTLELLDSKTLSFYGLSGTPSATTSSPATNTHLGMWQKVAAGGYGNKELVGTYTDEQGFVHELRAGVAGGTPGFIHTKYKAGLSDYPIIEDIYANQTDFLAADLSKFQKPTVTTAPVGPPPKTVPKLTNAIIYGKYKDGEVIAVKFNPPADATPQRLVSKNNKIVHEVKDPSTGKWLTTATYGKAEAYKKIGGTGPWSLGEPPAPTVSGGGPMVISTPTIPTPPVAPPTPTTAPTVATVTYAQKVTIKGVFAKKAVKWHTASGTMLETAAEVQKKHPELTLGQILGVMDTTTNTQTSPKPFTHKIAKYLSTAAGKQQAKKLGLSDTLLTTNATSKPGTSTTSFAPTTVAGPGVLHTLTEVPTSHAVKAPPEGFKIHSNAEMATIQQQMHAQYGDWTSSQQAALKKYTGSSYEAMNGCWRDPKTCSAATLASNKQAAAAMRPLTTSIRVTRGTGWGAIPGAKKIAKEQGAAAAIAYIQAQDGRLLQEPGFLSTSSAKTPAFGGVLRFEIDVPEGVPAAWVKNISYYGSENELLLAPGLKYRIKKVSPPVPGKYSSTLITMEVVYP